jgi:hypothetical protein
MNVNLQGIIDAVEQHGFADGSIDNEWVANDLGGASADLVEAIEAPSLSVRWRIGATRQKCAGQGGACRDSGGPFAQCHGSCLGYRLSIQIRDQPT